MKQISAYDAQHIQAILKEREEIFRLSFPVPFVLIMTDEAGTVLFSMTHPVSPAPGSEPSYPVGSNMLSRKMNAVSQAMARGKDVYVRGDESWLQDGKGWSCFALQMWNDSKEIIGCLAIYAKPDILEMKTYPFVKSIAALLEKEIHSRVPRWNDFSRYLSAQLLTYDLTPRERQIAALWLMDYDYKKIGREMGISENTVRVMTGRMNAKLGVKSKASLILRVVGAI